MSLKTYLTNKLNATKLRLTDILPTTHLPNKKRLSQAFLHRKFYRADQLPPKVDLRPDMTPVEHQSKIGSSVANCLAGAYEYLTKEINGRSVHVSRLFIYYNARVQGNYSGIVIDSGCSMTKAIEGLKEFGTCLESFWPYDISQVNTRPNDPAYEQAENHKINEALRISIDLNEMKSCLAQGFPFAFGLRLYPSFDKAAGKGLVPIPRVWEHNRPSNGSHALLAVGYSDQSNAFIVRNSWGENWGDEGYCYIPYDYMTNPDLCFDVWTIRKVANDDFGREYWHFDDLVDYLNDNGTTENFDEEFSSDNDHITNWRDYYNRKSVIDDPWDQYRKCGGNDFLRNDEDYFDDRNRRARYDRDNEIFDQQYRGYINNGFNASRNLSYPFYDRFRDEDNRYDDFDYYHHENNPRKSTS